MHLNIMPDQREALFNSPDLGDFQGGVAPFFSTLFEPVVDRPDFPG